MLTFLLAVIQKTLKSPLFYIFIIALFLRIYKLGDIPDGFHVDEAKVGWNAYSILKTGRDDWANKLALHYNSFGDFRPTGYFYLTAPSIAIFGLNEFAVRFPSAFVGALSVIPLFYLTFFMTKNKKISYVSSLLLAISLWHISLSRATSEGIVTLFFVLTGLLFLISSILNTKKSIFYLILSFIFLSTSYFFYHSARVLSPVIALSIVTYYTITKNKKLNLKANYIFLILSLFLLTLVFSLNKEARGRFSQVSIFNDLSIKYMLDKLPFEEGQNKVFIARAFHNKLVLYTSRFIEEYSEYFSAKFFINDTGSKPIRYNTVGNGLLSYIEFFLLVIGLFAVSQKKYPSLPLILFLIAPLPAALTTEDSPNIQRAIFMIPFISILGAYGFFKIYMLYPRLSGLLLGALGLNFIYFSHMYLVHNRIHEPIPINRNSGVKETIAAVLSYKNRYDQIYLTNRPDDLYPWFAFYAKSDPRVFNEKAKTRDRGAWFFENITFAELKCPSHYIKTSDNPGKKILLVDAEGCDLSPQDSLFKKILEIKRPEGGIPYTFWSN